MGSSKTGTPLKSVFDPAKAEAAAAVMHPRESQPAARNRKAGGRGVRISGYLPEDIDKALGDEVIRRTVEGHRPVSFNDVLCSILIDWKNSRTAAP
jgi:hypothetical protein